MPIASFYDIGHDRLIPGVTFTVSQVVVAQRGPGFAGSRTVRHAADKMDVTVIMVIFSFNIRKNYHTNLMQAERVWFPGFEWG